MLHSAYSVAGRLVAVALVALSLNLASCSVPLPAARGTAVAQYDPESGRLKRLEFDTTENGRNDAVGIMDGTRVERIEVDEDEDGRVDRWEFYDENRRLKRIGFSRHRNGVIDAFAFYGEDGAVARIEISTRGDGHFNRIEYYRAGALTRVDEDTNGDGRTDKWETYALDGIATPGRLPSIVTAAFDDSFRGTPNRRIVYSPRGSLLRIEVDPDGDGTFVEAAPTGGQ